MKRTRRRSSGTRQAFASQENTRLLLLGGAPRLGGSSASPRPRRAPRRLRSASSASAFGEPASLRASAARLRLAAEPGDRAAGRLDLLARGRREAVRRDGQLLRQLAVAEDLDVDARVPDQARPLSSSGVTSRPVEALEVADVDRTVLRPVRADRHRVLRVRAALLAEAHVDRHLAALEAGAHLVRARARLLALDPAARVAALARAQAAADALAVLARLRRA